MNNKLEVIGIDHGWSMMKTISQVFVTGVKEITTRKEVIRLLGGVISGMNVGQPVIMQAANSETQELTEDVMDDADVAGLAMGWMSKGD